MKILATLSPLSRAFDLSIVLRAGWGGGAEGEAEAEEDGQTVTFPGSVFSLSLCHKGHPGYSRCVWEQL